jgi:hypothetical protein
MLASAGYALEHFYYGQLFYQGRPHGELRLLASSPGVKTEHANEAMTEARLPPMLNVLNGSWALLRGKTIPFMLAQAQIGDSGQAMRHVILVPVDVLRTLGGNLRVLSRLIDTKMPLYESVGHTIPLLTLPQAGVPSLAAQETAMLALMTATRDRMDVIESLLAAIIQGVQVVITNAPADPNARVTFIEGLLTLLPPPARFGVTFATHTLQSTRVDAQIRFLHEGAAQPNSLIFNWETSELSGKKVEDEYSRYIKSQLRLDMSMVIQQTSAMTAVAGWRLKRGDSLSEALKYASYRLKIDTSISNGMPVASNEAAKILAEDPTLTDDLRAAYVRHLLAFALVLDEIEHADVLAVVVRGQPDLERVIMKQMTDALSSGRADRVYRTLLRWLSNPLGFKGMYWIELAQKAAAAYAEQLAKNGVGDALNAFLRHVQRSGSVIEGQNVIPRLIEIALPLAVQHQALSETVFLLGAHTLSGARWLKFASVKPLVARLPAAVGQLIACLTDESSPSAPPGLLAQAAGALGDDAKPLLAIRFAELAMLSNRRDTLDNAALGALVTAALSPYGKTYDALLRSMVRTLSSDETLETLGMYGSRYLLQLLLARQAYDELAVELLHQNRLLYPTDKMLSYATLLRGLFLETPFPKEDTALALKALNDKGLKPLPLAMAYFGALEQHSWTQDSAASELTALVFGNRMIIEAIQLELLMQLLAYHVRRRDSNFTVRVSQLIPVAAARKGEEGIAPMIEMYKLLDWDDPVKGVAMDSLRRFVRRCSDAVALEAVNRFKAELGEKIGEGLEAAYILKRMMGGESLADYAYSIHTTAQFLYDTGLTFVDKSKLPSIPALLSDLDSLNGGLNDTERNLLSSAVVDMLKTLALLAAAHRQVHSRENEDQIQQLIDGKGSAQTIFDIFRVMGGYFARGRRLSARTDKLSGNHPLADRSAPILMREINQIARLLKNALRTFPPDTARISITAEAIQGELESLWSDIALHERRTLVRDLAIDMQRIPELTLMMTERADLKGLQDGNNGLARKLDANRHRPENAMEFYRFLHGYFRSRVKTK